MASILPGFEYDIFISYRHNDNRSGWVREFVQALREELAATLKNPVYIYFDENPHDGLLESHLVDDSLRDKLNCLIFIPILSQTYCDEKSFAWQHEFLVFKKMTSEDSIGLKIKLPNGNTASRILPIRIHDLDLEDKLLLEKELGNILRSIDFIFKSAGVNRPLRAHEEHSQDNLNKTFYRDQVNKVANSIKEIVAGMKGGNKVERPAPTSYGVPSVPTSSRKRLALVSGILLFFMLAAFLIYNFRQPKPAPMESSIAVLAFDDLSENHDQEYFSDGISEEIINALVKIEGLKVPGRTSTFSFKGKRMDLVEIGKKLNVSFILEGSVRKSGDNLRITAQLIDASNGFHLWSETYDHKTKDIFKAQDEITKGIVKQLQKRVGIGTMQARKLPTENLEAYDLYLKGHKYFLMKGKHVIKAREFLDEAIRLDPNFAMAHAALAEAYAVGDLGMGDPQKAFNSATRALELDSTLSSAYAVIAWIQAAISKTDTETATADLMHNYFERAIELDPQNSTAHLWFGISVMHFGLFDQAITHLQTALEIDPLVAINYGMLGWAEYISGLDSIGYLHLSEGVKLGWDAGLQRLAFYHLDHAQWDKAELYFKEHAAKTPMSIDIDYHALTLAVQKKDIAVTRKILDSITNGRGFTAGFKARISYLVGDYDGAVAAVSDWGITEGMRPSRSPLRNNPGFRKYLIENDVPAYWKKFGWPSVCAAVGDNDFKCQ